MTDLKKVNIISFDPVEMARQLSIDAFQNVISKINPAVLLEQASMELDSVVYQVLETMEFDSILSKLKEIYKKKRKKIKRDCSVFRQ